MAYQKQQKRILTGGLNLLPPSDLVQSDDSIALQNWRSDQEGNLRSRLGESTIATIGHPINSIFLRNTLSPTRYYSTTHGGLIRTASLVTGAFDGTPIDMATYLGFVWVMNRAKRGKDNGAFTPWLPEAPSVALTVAVGAAGVLTGDYQYYYTFDTDAGHESDLSPISAVVSPAAQKVDLTAIAVSSDAQVTKRRIYRSGGSQDALYQIATLNDNTTLIYTDNLSDDDAARLGITHTADQDPPPPAWGLTGP